MLLLKNFVYITENRNNLQVAFSSAVTQVRSGTSESQDYQEVQKGLNYKETFDDNGDIITDGTSDADDADNYLRKAVKSMAGNVENDALTMGDFNLEELFEKYCDECHVVTPFLVKKFRKLALGVNEQVVEKENGNIFLIGLKL